MPETKLVAPRVEFSPGLKQVLAKYCEYRGWSTVAPETAEKVRALINRAGSVEDALAGLAFFFESRWADDWVCEERPNIGPDFLEQNWERFEIYRAELPKHNYFSSFSKNEYALMRGMGV